MQSSIPFAAQLTYSVAMYGRSRIVGIFAAAITIIVLANNAASVNGSTDRPNFVIFFAGGICQSVKDDFVLICQ